MSAPSYTFLPYLRRGAALRLNAADDGDPTLPAWRALGVKVTLSGETVEVPLNLLGPGDIAGLDSAQIARREPGPGSAGIAPNGFPLVEFTAADLPWRFSPLSAGPMDRVRPWLALIALRAPPGFAVSKQAGAPLPVITAPRAELPDLADSHAWAHVQVDGPFSDGPADLAEYVEALPERAVARRICPRRLEARSRYIVCLVPAFDVGRLAGLGETLPEEPTLLPAWTPGEEGTVTLPVYDSWSFSTGERGDFESIVRRLQPKPLPEGVGELRVEADADLAPPPQGDEAASFPLHGALRPVGVDGWDDPSRATIAAALTGLLDQAADLEDQGGEAQLAPPLYGRAAAGLRRVPPAEGDAPWLRELNLDPRHRVAAGLGAAIVRRGQEEFVRSAWEQSGALRRANTMLRGAQLARVVHQRLVTRHLGGMDSGRFLKTVGPAQDRLPHGDKRLFHGIVGSRLPSAGADGSFRRIAGAGSTANRRFRGRAATSARVLHLRFDDPRAFEGWEVTDQGAYYKPSAWAVDQGVLRQTRDTYSPPASASDPPKLGTFAVYRAASFADMSLTVRLQSLDDDAIGVMFRYRDPYNYYRLSMDSQRNYRRLVKCVSGVFSVLWEENAGYTVGAVQEVEILVHGDRLRGSLDGVELFDLRDDTHRHGSIGLYCWGNKDARFHEVEVRQSPRRSPTPGSRRLHADLQPTHDDVLPAWETHDHGDQGGAGSWVRDHGALFQTGTIHSQPDTREHLEKFGTDAFAGDPAWTDLHLSARLQSLGQGSLGLLFRASDASHYYRFAINRTHGYRRLVRRDGDTVTTLWEDDADLDLGRPYRVDLVAIGARITGYVDGRWVFSVRDDTYRAGRVGLYAWNNSGARFSDLVVSSGQPGDVLTRLDDADFEPAPTDRLPEGLATLDRTVRHLVDIGAVPQANAAQLANMDTTQTYGLPVTIGPKRSNFRLMTPESDGTPPNGLPGDSPDALAFRPKLAYHQDAIRVDLPEAPALDALGVGAAQGEVLAALDSQEAVGGRARRRLTLDPEWTPRDPTDALQRTPELAEPLCRRLLALDPEMLLPGIAGVPVDSVITLETNPAFIRSLMVGANHEMARELVWRGFPGDPRGTSFRRFWDVRGGAEAGALAADIDPIRSWSAQTHIDDGLSGAGEGRTVFMLRGELIRRFPDAIIYCARAVQEPGGERRTPGDEVELPLFRGLLGDDLAYFGFSRSPVEMSAGEGWFFVIQQRPGATRFGLDEAEDADPMATWRDLTWAHVNTGAGSYLTLGPLGQGPAESGSMTWAKNAAHMAAITLQRPMKVAIHIRDLLAAPESE